jgi:type IV secretion system protein VirB6
MPITPFTKLYSFFDDAVNNVIVNGTTNMIALISPLLAACFSIYVMLILFSYWKGDTDEPIMDFLSRLIGWGAIITFGLNIDMYRLYVVPLVTGLGEDLGGTVAGTYSSAAALDQLANAFVQAFIRMFQDASGFEETLFAVFAIASVGLFSGIFMVVAIAYIILAKLALGILVAVGPLFIAAALFPASRELFKNWTGQCLNYAFLVMLFSFAAQIEIQMVNGLIPQDMTLSALFEVNLVCAVFILVSLNLPSLASALAGGVGISSMVRKMPGMPRMPSIGGGKDKGGGEIKPGTPTGPAPGGAVAPEQK